jgi:chromosome segregation ATPase
MFSTKLVAIAAAAVLIPTLAFSGWTYIKLKNAEADKAEAISQRDAMATQLDLAVQANQTSQATIDQLKAEKQDIEAALASLEALRRRDRATIAGLSKAITEQANNPENQVKLSPVLQQIVDQIQQQRSSRGVK